ncbi:MAG: nucleotidyltransferase domain-containing protein [Nanoarchaeota archaeon]
MTKINEIFEDVLEKNKIPESEKKFIKQELKSFGDKLEKNITSKKIKAEVFFGGSFARDTMTKREQYDADVFVRFDKQYKKENLTEMLEKILKPNPNLKLIHGSRNYFKLKASENFEIEIIPVLKISKPEEADNITDLSYFHVNYIKRKMSEKIKREVIIAKVFCQANHVYGAESYIQGFSGYALELLMIKYKSFLNFLKEVNKIKNNGKLIVDIEKHYKNKNQIMMDLNESKLGSPIILVDPTYKQRNALAALSLETFNKFKEEARKFLKVPSAEFFKERKVDVEKIKEDAKKKKEDFIFVEIWTDKQEGDIAGSKLLKFYRHLLIEIERFFDVKNKGFNYNGKHAARFFFAAQKKKEIVVGGPMTSDKKNVKAFQKRHKVTYTKKGRFYAKEIVELNLKRFIDKWKKKNANKVKGMYITEIKIL